MDYLNYDLELLEKDLLEDSFRLFMDDHESYIQVVEASGSPFCLEGTASLVEYLERSINFQGTRIISIPQLGSIGQLGIPHTGFMALFTSLGPFPPLLEMVRCFGTKVNHDPNPIAPYQEYTDHSNDVHYCSFVIKYADEHGRSDAVNPWTIRQMGIHLRSDRKQTQHTVILINPVRRIAKRFQEAYRERNLEPEDVLCLAFSTALHKWPAHLDYLERSCNQLETKASAHSVSMNDDGRMRFNLDLSGVDLEHLQRIRRSLHGAIRSLQVDLDTLNALRSQERAKSSLKSASVMIARISNELERSRMLHMSLNDTAGLVRTVLERQQSEKASEMARLAAVDTSVMLELSRKSRRDSRTLKVITILTLLYLPASFVSTLLGMGYLHVAKNTSHLLSFDPEFLIFVVLTICFLCITIGFWLWFEFRARCSERTENVHGAVLAEKQRQDV